MMSSNKIVRIIVILLILCANVGCDQVSKHIVRRNVAYHENITVIKNFITLTKVENTGAFLSLGDSLPKAVSIILLTILPFIILGLGLIYIFTVSKLSNLRMVAICLIIGGGFGNIFDRAVYGSVTDFLHMNFGIFRTGVFNVADVSIMTGMFMILFETYVLGRRKMIQTVDNNIDSFEE